jgi:hypothetical protein
MTSRELAPTLAVIPLLNIAAYTADQGVVLDTLGYAHGLKGADAAAMSWDVGAYGSGSFTATLQESANMAGPFTAVDPMFYDWYVNGQLHPGGVTVADAGGSQHRYVVSYKGGLLRYIELIIHPLIAGTLTYGVSGLLLLTETYKKAYTDYTP